MTKCPFVISLAFLAYFMHAEDAQAAGKKPPRPQVDKSGKGAVLCSHMIYVVLHEVGRLCHPERDATAIAVLRDSLQRHEEFIARNSDMSIDQARRLTKNTKITQVYFGKHDPETASCGDIDPEVAKFYDLFRKASGKNKLAAAIEKDTKETLSLDRKPVFNPCL